MDSLSDATHEASATAAAPASLATTSLPDQTTTNTTATTTSLPPATPISLDALTTPFTAPSGCVPIPSMAWTAATVHLTIAGRNDTTTYHNYLLADVDDRGFSECQPSGWDSVATRSRFSYSPAVCPSGWGYYSLSDDLPSQPSDTATVRSSALCCPSGFSFTPFYEASATGIQGPYCISRPTTAPKMEQRATGSVTTATANTTTINPLATKLYPVWDIFWEQQDASKLSPEPPVLLVGATVPSWIPGTKIDSSYKRSLNDGSAFGRDISNGIIAIVVGTIGGIIVIAAISLFFVLRSRKRNKQVQQAIELQERYDSSRRDRVPDEPLPIYPSQGTRDNTVHIAGHQPGGQSHLPPYKERASEDSSRNSPDQDEDRGNSSSGHERQQSSDSASAEQHGGTGRTTRQQQTNDDITGQQN